MIYPPISENELVAEYYRGRRDGYEEAKGVLYSWKALAFLFFLGLVFGALICAFCEVGHERLVSMEKGG